MERKSAGDSNSLPNSYQGMKLMLPEESKEEDFNDYFDAVE